MQLQCSFVWNCSSLTLAFGADVCMAGMPIFAHAGREKLTPPPLSAPLKRIKVFCVCLFCSAKHAKTRGKPLVYPNVLPAKKISSPPPGIN